MNLNLFRKMMLLWSVCFLIAGLFFIITPHTVIALLNHSAQLFHFSKSIPFHEDYLWLSLAGSMMITISYLSYEAYKNPKNHPVIQGLLICKLASSLLFIISAWRTQNNTYLLGTAVDFPIFLIIFIFYLQTRRLSRE
ncbi:MAG: hypothetical protein HYW47_05175 [Deltaproteobacteria bacterium]|nr:hypothetical protein [Deltaproteobacteria bacterium]